jgi:3-oxoadipate enol-lactonase
MSPLVTLNGVAHHYRQTGDGYPIVWVMGTGMNGDAWHRFQVPYFSPSYRCVTYDMRGVGRSDCPAEPYDPPTLAHDLAALVDHLEIERAHFVGFSLGAATVQELALLRPELVTSAVLLSTWSSTMREHHMRRHYESRLFALENGPMEVFKKFAFWMWAPSMVDDEYETICELETFLALVTGSKEASGFAGHFRADLAHDTLDRLAGITAPTLVLHGDEDLITLPTYNRRVAERIPNATLVEIRKAGHLAYLEQPAAINAAIADFLTKVGPR